VAVLDIFDLGHKVIASGWRAGLVRMERPTTESQ
jgi:hypothetical protein